MKMIMLKCKIKSFGHESKSNLHYTRDITPKRVTSGGVHLLDLAPGQHSSEVVRAIGDNVSNLTCQGIEPQTSPTDSHMLNN